jgi:hypothetical protein
MMCVMTPMQSAAVHPRYYMIRSLYFISVMRLIRNWVKNENVLIANDVLADIHRFISYTTDSSGVLNEIVMETLQYIPDKV